MEDSPITKVGISHSPTGKFEEGTQGSSRNIGLYMKSGYCYCDIKSFVPTIVCLALVAIWFSDNKTKKASSKLILVLMHNRGN